MKVWRILLVLGALLLMGIALAAAILLPRFFKEDAQTAWTYNSRQYGFSMTLPSNEWQEIQKRGMDVAFYNRKHATLVGVTVAPAHREEFHQRFVEQLQDHFNRNQNDLIGGPKRFEGETPAGNPYVYWTAESKAGTDGTVFVAMSAVWCKNKMLVVQTTLEGPLLMKSDMLKAAEMAFFENAVQTICLSPQ